MDNQNLPARPKVVYSESNSALAYTYGEILTDLGMQVVDLESNLLVAEYLQKNIDVAAVILRNESFGPDEEKGLTIAPQLIRNEGFSNPIIVLTGAYSKEMTEKIPEEYRQTEQIVLFDSVHEIFASLFGAALKAKFPIETEGLGREDLIKLFGYRINEYSGLIDQDKRKSFWHNSFKFVWALQNQGGLKETIEENLALLENWRATHEGGTTPQQRK